MGDAVRICATIRHIDGVNGRCGADLRNNSPYGRARSQNSCAAGGGRAAHLRRHRAAGEPVGAVGKAARGPAAVKRRAGGVHGGGGPRGDGVEHGGAGGALLPAGDDARRGGGHAPSPSGGGGGVERHRRGGCDRAGADGGQHGSRAVDHGAATKRLGGAHPLAGGDVAAGAARGGGAELRVGYRVGLRSSTSQLSPSRRIAFLSPQMMRPTSECRSALARMSASGIRRDRRRLRSSAARSAVSKSTGTISVTRSPKKPRTIGSSWWPSLAPVSTSA